MCKYPSLLIVFVIVLASVSSPAFAGPSPEQRAAFQQLVAERNRLHQQLETLDRQAADKLKRGDEAVAVHSRQVSVQDQLDQVQLRLDVLALRHDLTVPPIPERRDAADGEHEASDQAGRRHGEQAFARGRARAIEQLRQDTRRMLASLDFTAFLEDPEVSDV